MRGLTRYRSLVGTSTRLTATLTALLVAACSSTGQGNTESGLAEQQACVEAPIRRDARPSWTASASIPPTIPFSLGSGDPAAAFFFNYPLRAGHPTNPSNKVLWVVEAPRNNQPLVIVAQQMSPAGQTVDFHWEANAGPGEIYPSTIDLPSPGCWRLVLRWGPHRATIDMQVRPRMF